MIYYNAMSKWGNKDWAAVSVYAGLLSQFPDSHIERKYGDQYSEMVASKMSQLSNELSKAENPEHTLPLLYSMDQELKSRGVNPGTMADMTVATVLTVFLEDFLNKSSK
jgi:triphosphoribosyl-dephospho-CoA synthase